MVDMSVPFSLSFFYLWPPHITRSSTATICPFSLPLPLSFTMMEVNVINTRLELTTPE